MVLEPTAFMKDRWDLLTFQTVLPGAGANAVFTVPGNQVLQVVSFHIALQTNATVIDRLVYCRSIDIAGGINTQAAPAPVVQPASNLWAYEFSVGIAPADWSADFDLQFAPLPCCVQVKPGDQFVVGAVNLQGADQFTIMDLRCMVWLEN